MSRVRRSLRLRLAAGAAIAVMVALVIAGFGLTLLFERHAARRLAEDLDVHLRQLAGGLEVDAAGALTLSRPPADPRFADPLSGLYWQVTSPDGTLLRSRSLWDTVLRVPEDRLRPDGEVHRHVVTGPEKAALVAAERVVHLDRAPGDGRVRLVVAADLAGVKAARDAFGRDLVPALALLAAVLAIAGWVQIGLGLKPLGALGRGIAAIRSGAAQRLDPDVPSEVAPLVDELNALLAAQADEIARARARAADLAHGLKTPLAALAGDAERLAAKGETEIAADVAAVGDAMRRHVERELARSRLAAPARGVRTEVAPVVRRLIETLKRTPAGEGLTHSIDVPATATAAIDADDLVELLGNLLENAVRHARGRVVVTWREGAAAAAHARDLVDGEAPAALLTICDDGPGIPIAARARVLERGMRLDESSPGTGLGLAIAQDIATAYGHRLMLGEAAIGGLEVGIGFVGPA